MPLTREWLRRCLEFVTVFQLTRDQGGETRRWPRAMCNPGALVRRPRISNAGINAFLHDADKRLQYVVFEHIVYAIKECEIFSFLFREFLYNGTRLGVSEKLKPTLAEAVLTAILIESSAFFSDSTDSHALQQKRRYLTPLF